jgi:hypothetical protein
MQTKLTNRRLALATLLLGACGTVGMFTIYRYPQHLMQSDARTLDTIFWLTLGALLAGFLVGITVLRGVLRSAGRATASLLLCGLLLSCIGLAGLAFGPPIGARSVMSSQNACINNLRTIEKAKAEWAQSKAAPSGSAVSWSDIAPYLMNPLPKCPDGGSYSLGSVGEQPTCSIASHNVP